MARIAFLVKQTPTSWLLCFSIVRLRFFFAPYEVVEHRNCNTFRFRVLRFQVLRFHVLYFPRLRCKRRSGSSSLNSVVKSAVRRDCSQSAFYDTHYVLACACEWCSIMSVACNSVSWNGITDACNSILCWAVTVLNIYIFRYSATLILFIKQHSFQLHWKLRSKWLRGAAVTRRNTARLIFHGLYANVCTNNTLASSESDHHDDFDFG